MALIILIFLLIIIGYVILTYNRLVQYKVQIENAWSQISVQLKRRYDLIPNHFMFSGTFQRVLLQKVLPQERQQEPGQFHHFSNLTLEGT